jgi:hypothetical protein
MLAVSNSGSDRRRFWHRGWALAGPPWLRRRLTVPSPLQKLERSKCSSHEPRTLSCISIHFHPTCVLATLSVGSISKNTPSFGLFIANVERGRPLNEALNKSDVSERKPRPRQRETRRAEKYTGRMRDEGRSSDRWWRRQKTSHGLLRISRI